MPEGDVVWRTARSLDKALSGEALLRSDLRVPSLATVDVTGEVVHATVSRGKHLLTRIGDNLTLHTHLKMEGAWHLYRPETRWRRPAHEARVLLGTPRWLAVGFTLGVVELVERDREDEVVGHLGPDLLGDDWSVQRACQRISIDPDRGIFEALLDQRNLAGLGTIWAGEALFAARVSPALPVGEVPDLAGLVTRAQGLISQARQGRDPRQPWWVHRRDRHPCPRCGGRIRAGQLGPTGRERTAYWCEVCQAA